MSIIWSDVAWLAICFGVTALLVSHVSLYSEVRRLKTALICMNNIVQELQHPADRDCT